MMLTGISCISACLLTLFSLGLASCEERKKDAPASSKQPEPLQDENGSAQVQLTVFWIEREVDSNGHFFPQIMGNSSPRPEDDRASGPALDLESDLVLTEPQFQVILRWLYAKSGAGILAMPKIQVRPGRKATVEVTREFSKNSRPRMPQKGCLPRQRTLSGLDAIVSHEVNDPHAELVAHDSRQVDQLEHPGRDVPHERARRDSEFAVRQNR